MEDKSKNSKIQTNTKFALRTTWGSCGVIVQLNVVIAWFAFISCPSVKDILDHGSRETLQTAQLLLGLSLICVGCRNGCTGILHTCVRLSVNGEKQEREHEKQHLSGKELHMPFLIFQCSSPLTKGMNRLPFFRDGILVLKLFSS